MLIVFGGFVALIDTLTVQAIVTLLVVFELLFPVNERAKFQFRAEFFNFTNTARFATPYSAFGDGDFGRVTTQSNSPRRTQIAVRFEL